MEIERINENTLKLSISYNDIEQRGFHRDEIWYNRDRSEELFWEVMDEINEDFNPNGPLWIQVQALEKGLEIIVTQAQMPIMPKKNNLFDESNTFDPLESLVNTFKENVFYAMEGEVDDDDDEDDEDEDYVLDSMDQTNKKVRTHFIFLFKDIENLILLSNRIHLDHLDTKLYVNNNQYYLMIQFPAEDYNEKALYDQLAIILEYGEESRLTVAYLEDYGKLIMEGNVISQLKTYFN